MGPRPGHRRPPAGRGRHGDGRVPRRDHEGARPATGPHPLPARQRPHPGTRHRLPRLRGADVRAGPPGRARTRDHDRRGGPAAPGVDGRRRARPRSSSRSTTRGTSPPDRTATSSRWPCCSRRGRCRQASASGGSTSTESGVAVPVARRHHAPARRRAATGRPRNHRRAGRTRTFTTRSAPSWPAIVNAPDAMPPDVALLAPPRYGAVQSGLGERRPGAAGSLVRAAQPGAARAGRGPVRHPRRPGPAGGARGLGLGPGRRAASRSTPCCAMPSSVVWSAGACIGGTCRRWSRMPGSRRSRRRRRDSRGARPPTGPAPAWWRCSPRRRCRSRRTA